MKKNNKGDNAQKNNINDNEERINNKLLNLIKYKLFQPNIGCFYGNRKINSNLNFSSLEPILSNGKKILVGDGSFSKVFLYQHKTSKIKYAIKKINIPSFLKKTNNKNLILEEINIQSKIMHPNIIRLFNYFKDKNNINMFLILEYASKGTLFDYIHHKNGFDETEAFYFFFQAVNAIYFLHKNKIIHRDLKPENLLINHNNILKLCDFGWSVYLNNNKRVTFCGTVEYMAPEIVKNESYDYSIDVWSLGVLLYELIHSHSPFVVKDLNINKIENNILSKELRFKKDVSLECRDLIEKLLIKDAKNRMKIGEIFTHPFILKYINMITNFINIHKNTNYEKIQENEEDNEKNEIIKREKYDEIRESFSEFDTIPNEPEPSKILVNFDNIVRKFTKIDYNINKKRNEKIMNKNKMMNVKSLKSLINKNLTKEIKYIKSLTLNNSFFQNLGINNSAKNIFNNNKEKYIMNENLEEKENKNMNLNKENLMKLLIKKTKNDNPDLQIQIKKYTKNTLMEEYNNNLNKKYMNKNKIINKNENSKLKGNSSYSKNLLITSYISKNNKKKLIKKKLVENLTEKDINNKSKLNKSTNLNLKNCKSISFFKNLKGNNLSKEYSDYSNSNSSRKINLQLKNNKNYKTNILIKHIKTSNKNNNNKDLSCNILKKPHSKEIFRNKYTLNLSNINVYNFCSSRTGLNNTKYFNHINTFIIMDKSRDLKMNKSEKNNLYQKSPKTARMEKKKNSNIFLSNKKSKENNINFNKTGIQNKAKLKNNQKLVLNYPESNKNIEKERKLSSRNAKNKKGNTNNIFLYNNSN